MSSDLWDHINNPSYPVVDIKVLYARLREGDAYAVNGMSHLTIQSRSGLSSDSVSVGWFMDPSKLKVGYCYRVQMQEVIPDKKKGLNKQIIILKELGKKEM